MTEWNVFLLHPLASFASFARDLPISPILCELCAFARDLLLLRFGGLHLGNERVCIRDRALHVFDQRCRLALDRRQLFAQAADRLSVEVVLEDQDLISKRIEHRMHRVLGAS